MVFALSVGRHRSPPPLCTSRRSRAFSSCVSISACFNLSTCEGFLGASFRQKRPDPDRPGRWISNVDGVRRALPYRLTDLLLGDVLDAEFFLALDAFSSLVSHADQSHAVHQDPAPRRIRTDRFATGPRRGEFRSIALRSGKPMASSMGFPSETWRMSAICASNRPRRLSMTLNSAGQLRSMLFPSAFT